MGLHHFLQQNRLKFAVGKETTDVEIKVFGSLLRRGFLSRVNGVKGLGASGDRKRGMKP